MYFAYLFPTSTTSAKKSSYVAPCKPVHEFLWDIYTGMEFLNHEIYENSFGKYFQIIFSESLKLFTLLMYKSVLHIESWQMLSMLLEGYYLCPFWHLILYKCLMFTTQWVVSELLVILNCISLITSKFECYFMFLLAHRALLLWNASLYPLCIFSY